MSNFKYSLESILELRKSTEDQKKTTWAKCHGDYEHHKDVLKEGREHYGDLLETMDQAKKKDMNYLRQTLHYQAYLQGQLTKQEEKTDQARLEMEEAQTDLIKARIESRILDKHKEGAYRKFVKKQEKEEQKTLDELAVNKYNYLKRGRGTY